MVETKFDAWSAVPEAPIWIGARTVEPTFSRPRKGPGRRNTAANSTTTRVDTHRGSRRRGGSLIISDTVAARSAGLPVPYAELLIRSIPCPCHARRNRADLRQDGPASSFAGTADRPGQARANRRRQGLSR